MSTKSNQPKECFWCRKQRYLMPANEIGEQICGFCDEDAEYIEHFKRVLRAERINKKYEKERR